MSFRGLMTGVSGLQSQAKKMEVIGNNLSNINTTAFKKGEVQFQELFYDTIKGASAAQGNLGGTNPMSVGSGVQIGSINNVFTQGSRLTTGRSLDFMIEGQDFFAAKNGADGSLMLTRSGSFQIDSNMNLVDNLGNKIQGFTVDRETQDVSQQAGDIFIEGGSIDPKATTVIDMSANIDSSSAEVLASQTSNAWELFSGGENFGSMGMVTTGGQGSRQVYGSGFYSDSTIYQDSTATINAGLNIVTLGAAPLNLAEGFAIGDTVSVLQGANQVQRTITGIAGNAITLNAAAPGSFAAGGVTITNLTDGTAKRGSSGAAAVHQDILQSQISMIDQNGRLLASFYRVSEEPMQYTRATANVAGGSTSTVGIGEFRNMQELSALFETTLRDTNLTNYAASTDLDISMDKFGQVNFSGTGLVQSFRLVMNADNTEMLDRFSGIAISDAAAVATTQARLNASSEIIAPPALGLGNRTVHSSKWWFNSAGMENYGYSSSSPATEYGEFAGLRFDNGASGSGFGTLTLSTTNGMGTAVTQEFHMVPRDADADANEFSTMGELARLMQNTLKGANFSSIAADGTLQADTSVSVAFVDGRLSVSTANGVFNNLSLTAMNDSADPSIGITRSDSMNFGTVLGELATGISGKSGSSNKFIEADARVQTRVHDNQGNEHTATSLFVQDRSSGLTNVEWKFRNSLNPNLNSFASEHPNDQDIYSNTYNSIEDSTGSRGVLAFDINTGAVLGATSGNDSRYVDLANLSFTPQTSSQEAGESNISIDFSDLTSYNGQNTAIGTNTDGYSMGNLVRIVTEENTGNINGVYTNGKIRTLAKIGLMNITNPEGLEKVGSSYYVHTPNSSKGGVAKGLDQIFAVGAQSPDSSDSVTSKIHGGALEASNVDLTEELTDMITTQRSYSAAGKIVTTTDDMLQEALNLKR